jgi:hypothetical protein
MTSLGPARTHLTLIQRFPSSGRPKYPDSCDQNDGISQRGGVGSACGPVSSVERGLWTSSEWTLAAGHHRVMAAEELAVRVQNAFEDRVVLSRAELLALGVSDVDLRRWMRRRLLQRPRPGWYCRPIAPTEDPELDAFVLALHGAVVAGSDVVVSHRSAARLWRLPVWGRPDPPEVTRR